MVILTNFQNFPLTWKTTNGVAGESRFVQSAGDYLKLARQVAEPVAVINCNPGLTLDLAARFAISPHAPPLVAVDLVLRRPRSLRSKLVLPFKRLLLNRVDLFIHYFRDLSAYRALFGIGSERSAFVSFKVNLFDRSWNDRPGSGDYVLCLGRTLRDFDTFFKAMEQLPYPAAIPKPDFHHLQLHGSRFTRALDQLPANVHLLDDDGSSEAMFEILRRAKVVAVPILRESMAASGCSTCLNAMSLGKCVVGTEGPGFSDVFKNGELLCVPPESPDALATAIRQVWEDDALRERIATAGQAYARQAGGEQDLYRRVVECVVDWYRTRYAPGHRASKDVARAQ